MATPNMSHPIALQPGKPSSPAPEPQYWQSLQQPSAQEVNAVHTSNRQPGESNIQKLSPEITAEDSASNGDTSTSEMASQQNYQANQSARYQSGQMPTHSMQGESSTRSGINSDDALRAQTSAFGASYGNSDNEANETPIMPNQPLPLFAQHSGPMSAHTPATTMQPGPSTVRTVPNTQSTPISSILHSPTSVQGTPTTLNRPATSTKSPFTSPITCPPRNRPNQILLINPTSTSALTNLLLYTIRPILPHGVEVTAYNAPYPSPTVIESVVDSVLSSETVLRDLAKYSTNNGETIQNYDALLVACYSKHPLIDALRESYDVPVIGILEASLYIARMLGGRFGIITTTTRAKLQIDDAVKFYGLDHFFTGAESLHISPLELLGPSFISTPISPDRSSSSNPSTPSTTSRSREEIHKRITVQARTLVAKGADTIILGSEFLSSAEAARIVKDSIREEDGRRTVNVIDAVEAGIMMLSGLVGMGVPTSKKGIFRSERDTRRGRGQIWL